MSLPSNSGIYQIRCFVNEKIYIGSAISFHRRWKRHKRELNTNRHHNKHLQNAWNKYGEGNFGFEIIEEVRNRKLLFQKEQHYLNERTPEYNICKIVRRLPILVGEDNPMFGIRGKLHHGYNIPRTKETRDKISKTKKQNFAKGKTRIKKGKEHHLYGTTLSDEHKKKLSIAGLGRRHTASSREKMSKSKYEFHKINPGINEGERNGRAKLTMKEVKEIRKEYDNGNIGYRKIAKKYNISAATVYRVVKRISWNKGDDA